MKLWERSLEKLLELIPPPSQPRYSNGPLLDPSLPALPEDHAAIIEAYGTGEFAYGNIGCVVELFNPRDPKHAEIIGELHATLREYRKSEGEEYMPYPVYPEEPGVMICGWNDSRDYWFWHRSSANCNLWPTVFYGNLQDAFQFDMSLVVFMQKLFCGEISRRNLNFAEPDFEPSGFLFRPSRR